MIQQKIFINIIVYFTMIHLMIHLIRVFRTIHNVIYNDSNDLQKLIQSAQARLGLVMKAHGFQSVPTTGKRFVPSGDPQAEGGDNIAANLVREKIHETSKDGRVFFHLNRAEQSIQASGCLFEKDIRRKIN